MQLGQRPLLKAGLRPISEPLTRQAWPFGSGAGCSDNKCLFSRVRGTGRHRVSLLPGAAVVLTVWALVTSPAFPPWSWPPCLSLPPPHTLARLHRSEAPASGKGPSEQVLMEGVRVAGKLLDQPLSTALGIQAKPGDSPFLLTLTRALGVPPGTLLE